MNYALIFAGGVGQRMNTVSLPKQFLRVHGKPIIVHTIEHFQKSDQIDGIIVVCLEDYISTMGELKEQYGLTKILSIVHGGRNGQESIFNGLQELSAISVNNNDIVLIHDGVRPLIDTSTIADNIRCVEQYGTCVTVAKAIETILLLDGKDVNEVVDRNNCYLGRAPQSFYFRDIYSCHLKSIEMNRLDFIDSATMMHFFGYKIYTVEGPANNIKVTTPMDFYLFKTMLDVKENEQIKVI